MDGLGWVGDGPDVVGNGWDGLGWIADGPDVVGNGWDPLGLGGEVSTKSSRRMHSFSISIRLTSERSTWQMDPSGCRVTAAAGIRLSTWMVQKVDTLRWFLTGIVLPDDDFDITKRSGRSRAARSCLETL